MQNLAGDENADKVIVEELRRCGITVVQNPKQIPGEVPATLSGKLGLFTFRRAWYYWIVNGPMPLDLAEILYEDPVGRTDIRAGGDCACRPPATWTRKRDAQGREVVDDRDGKASELLSYIDKDIVKDYLLSKDPDADTATRTVETYHIDSEVGLRVFADFVRKHFNIYDEKKNPMMDYPKG